MSTKATISHGVGFHLYTDCFDEENIYLELIDLGFSVSNNGYITEATVEIPNDIMDTITKAWLEKRAKEDKDK